MNEWLLILAAIMGFFILRLYLSKFMGQKLMLLISVICFIALVILFTQNLLAHFTYPLLIVFIIFCTGTLIDFYKIYARLQTGSK